MDVDRGDRSTEPKFITRDRLGSVLAPSSCVCSSHCTVVSYPVTCSHPLNSAPSPCRHPPMSHEPNGESWGSRKGRLTSWETEGGLEVTSGGEGPGGGSGHGLSHQVRIKTETRFQGLNGKLSFTSSARWGPRSGAVLSPVPSPSAPAVRSGEGGDGPRPSREGVLSVPPTFHQPAQHGRPSAGPRGTDRSRGAGKGGPWGRCQGAPAASASAGGREGGQGRRDTGSGPGGPRGAARMSGATACEHGFAFPSAHLLRATLYADSPSPVSRFPHPEMPP